MAQWQFGHTQVICLFTLKLKRKQKLRDTECTLLVTFLEKELQTRMHFSGMHTVCFSGYLGEVCLRGICLRGVSA